MSKRYKPHGDVNYVTREFFRWGRPIPSDYDVYIEVRDLVDDRGHVYQGGCHKVVVTGPQPRPRSKTFIGETAWYRAEHYADDCYQQLQKGLDDHTH